MFDACSEHISLSLIAKGDKMEILIPVVIGYAIGSVLGIMLASGIVYIISKYL